MAPLPQVEHVGRARFPAALAELRDIFQHASFVAFDTELSGLSAQLDRSSLMSSVAQRYQEMRTSAQSFAIVQFGLSCFTWRADKRVFEVRTFQFPIFPLFHPSSKNGHHSELPDRSFLAQAKCLTYIREHGFDLNAWVDDGIGYLSHDEQRRLAQVLEKPLREDVAAKFRGDAATKIRTAENERFLKDMRKRMNVLVKLTSSRDQEHEERTKATTEEEETQAAALFLGQRIAETAPALHQDEAGVVRRTFVTEPQAPFRRSALMALVDKEFPHVVVVDCPSDNDNDPVVTTAPWKRRLRIIAVSDTKEKTAFKAAHAKVVKDEHDHRNLSLVGFTTLFDLLLETGRRLPLVGHNMLLDAMQCYDKFHGPLPDSCSSFLFHLHKWLGDVTLFDTKVLIEHAMDHVDVFGERLEHSALEYVYETVSKDPFHGPPTRDATSSKEALLQENVPLNAHQAGYDAYMTGAVFLRACSGLGVPNDAIAVIGSLSRNHMNDEHEPKWRTTMRTFQNTLKLNQLLPPVALTLPGPFPSEITMPSREAFLRVDLTRAFLPKLKTHHIQHCVAWALNIRSNKLVKVRYETKSSVFIQLPSANDVERLIIIRKDCKETHGSERDPLPSLGCVELARIEEQKERSEETHSEANSKRQKIDGER